MTIDRRQFIAEYRRATAEVLHFITPESQALIARHNAGWHPDRYRFDVYLSDSEKRYLRVVDNVNRWASESKQRPDVLDVGGFLGAFPLALARLGADVTLAEEYGYYGTAFDPLADHLTAAGVTVWPVDFTRPLAEPQKRRFDLVTAMAILEHLPDSPEPIMANIRACTKPDGLAAIEVPNIAYWPNRVRALKGQSIHQPFELLYQSASPFTGHHREYTAQELGALLNWTGFSVVSVERFNYSMNPRSLPTSELIRLLIFEWPTLLIDSCRELILAMARPTAIATPGHADAAGSPRTPLWARGGVPTPE